MTDTKFSRSDIKALETIQAAPSHFSWDWMLQGGATLKVEIVGRWSSTEASKVRHLLGLMADIIDINAEEPLPEPPK